MTDDIAAVDTSDEACAIACMLVSDPQGQLRQDGWQKRVNNLIRALRDERSEWRQAAEACSAEANNKAAALFALDAIKRKTIEECASVAEKYWAREVASQIRALAQQETEK